MLYSLFKTRITFKQMTDWRKIISTLAEHGAKVVQPGVPYDGDRGIIALFPNRESIKTIVEHLNQICNNNVATHSVRKIIRFSPL